LVFLDREIKIFRVQFVGAPAHDAVSYLHGINVGLDLDDILVRLLTMNPADPLEESTGIRKPVLVIGL